MSADELRERMEQARATFKAANGYRADLEHEANYWRRLWLAAVKKP